MATGITMEQAAAAAAATIIEKLDAQGVGAEYVREHEREIGDYAVRLLASLSTPKVRAMLVRELLAAAERKGN